MKSTRPRLQNSSEQEAWKKGRLLQGRFIVCFAWQNQPNYVGKIIDLFPDSMKVSVKWNSTEAKITQKVDLHKMSDLDPYIVIPEEFETTMANCTFLNFSQLRTLNDSLRRNEEPEKKKKRARLENTSSDATNAAGVSTLPADKIVHTRSPCTSGGTTASLIQDCKSLSSKSNSYREAGLIPFSSESTPGSATWSGHSGIFGTMSDDRLKRMRLQRNPLESSSSACSSITEADPLRNEKIQEICKWIEHEECFFRHTGRCRENILLEWVFQLDSHERTDLINMVIDAMGLDNEVSSMSLMSAVRKTSHRWPLEHIRDVTNWINTLSQQERRVDKESQSEDLEVRDCDEADRDNPLAAVEYAEELYQYHKKAEQTKAPAMYMHRQPDISPRMRHILIDWLVDVHVKFRLVPATLYLCVHLIDRFCSSNKVMRKRLQLVGITALLLACKYEEIHPPEVRDCVYVTDHAYTREEVLAMEIEMLQHFEFNIFVPTSYYFLMRYLEVIGCVPKEAASFRASYYAEYSLQHHCMLLYKPSLVAAASIYLALKSERPDPWERVIANYSGYSLEQIIPCARQICHCIMLPVRTKNTRRSLIAVKKKFKKPKFLCVAEDPDPIC